MKTVTVNYKELTDALSKLEEDYPSRMYEHIVLLGANIKYHLMQFLSGNILIVELDDSIRVAYINGVPISGAVYGFPDFDKNPTSSEIMYEQILEAMKSAKQLGFYENVFHVKEIEKSDDGSILSKDSKKDNSFLDEVVTAVCIGGDCYSKFEHDVIRCFGEETNEKILRLLNELDVMHRLADGGSKRLTETYKLSLKNLGKDIGMDDKSIKEILEWQQKRVNHAGYDILLLLVVATNSSMKGLTPHHITKEEFIVNEIKDMVSHYKGYKYDYWNNLTLSIITYDNFANNHICPTRLQNIDENKIVIKTTEENTVRISEGLESALRIAQMNVGKTYMVLVSDGQDDDVERTKKVIDAIMHKRSIEFYTYFVDSLTYQNVNTIKRSAFCSIGGIHLSTPFVETLDWWVTRDLTLHPWYEQEEWYEQALNRLTNNVR